MSRYVEACSDCQSCRFFVEKQCGGDDTSCYYREEYYMADDGRTSGYAIKQWKWNGIFKEYYPNVTWFDNYGQAMKVIDSFTVTDDIPCIELFTATMDKYGQYVLDDMMMVIDNHGGHYDDL